MSSTNGKRLTDLDKLEILDLYERHLMSFDDIAKKVSRGKKTVAKVIHEYYSPQEIKERGRMMQKRVPYYG